MIVGIIPALRPEPSSLNTFLKSMVNELKLLCTEGVLLKTSESPNFPLLHRVALLCIACDIAARKVSGFLGHSATLGCSRCLKKFPGEVSNEDYSGFNRDS